MVLAARKPEPRRAAHRLNGRASPLTLALGAHAASERGKMRGVETDARKRAQLMALCKCALYVSESVGIGAAAIIDPETMEMSERATCPFQVKTLVVHPDDVDRAIGHFQAISKVAS